MVSKLNKEYTQQAVEEAWKKTIYKMYKTMNRECSYKSRHMDYHVKLLKLAQSQVSGHESHPSKSLRL